MADLNIKNWGEITSGELNPITGIEYKVPTKSKKDLLTPVPGQTMAEISTHSPINLSSQLEAIDYRKYFPEYSPSKYDQSLTESQFQEGLLNPASLEEYRSEEQGIGSSLGNATVKLLAKTGINVLGGTVGTVYGLANAISEGKLAGMWDNEVINELDSWSKGLDSAMPVYKSKDYINSNFGEKLLHPLMFADEMSDAISFTAGAILTELLTSGIASELVAARATSTLSKILKGTATANKVVGAADKAALLGMGKEALVFGRRLLTGANYEASIEANNAMMQYKQERVNDYMKENHIDSPDNVPLYILNQIEEDSQKLGNLVWGQNLAILNVSNMIQFPSTFGVKFNTAKKFLSPAIGRTAEKIGIGKALPKGVRETTEGLLESTAKDMTKVEKYLSNAYTFAKNGLTEGVWEEGMQTVVSEAAKDYWKRKFNNGNINDAVSYLDSFGEGLKQSYTTKEGLNQIGMGAIIGMMGAPGKGLLPGKLGIDKQTGKRGDIWQGGVVGEFKNRERAREQAERFAQKYNTVASNHMITPSMKAGINQLIVEQQNTTEANAALKNDDKFGYLNSKDDSFFEFVNTRTQAGKYSTIEDMLDSMEKMSPEAFKKEYYDETDTTEIDAVKQKSIINSLRQKARSIKERRTTIDAIVLTDPYHNYDEVTETYKDHLTYLMSKADMIDKRTDDIVKKIGEITGNYLNGRSLKEFYDLAAKTGVDSKTLQTLKNHIKGLNLLTKQREKNEPILTEQLSQTENTIKETQTQLDKAVKKKNQFYQKLQTYQANKGITGEEGEDYWKEVKQIEKDLKSSEKEVEQLQKKLDRNKADQEKYKQQLAEDKANLEKSQKEFDTFVEENRKSLREKSLKESKDNPKFTYDNFNDYVNDIQKLLYSSAEHEEVLKKFYEKDPLKANEVAPLVGDLGKLTKMRMDMINLYNLHRSSDGRNALMNAILKEAEDSKAQLLEQQEKIDKVKKLLIPGKNVKATVKQKDGSVKDAIGYVVSLKDGKVGLKFADGTFEEESIFNLLRTGILEDLNEVTEEQVKEIVEENKAKTFPNVNMETGVYSLTGTLYNVEEEGGESEYLLITTEDDKGNKHNRYYELDEDGHIEPHYETEFSEEAKLTKVKENSTHEFNGQLYNYTSKEGKTSIGVMVNVSPFLSQDKVTDYEKYPSSIVINYANGSTSAPIKDEDIIKELVDKALEAANPSNNPRFIKGKPIFNYKGEKVTVSYTLTKTTKTKKWYRKGKKWFYKWNTTRFNQGEVKMPAFYLEPKDKTIDELLETGEPLTSSQFHTITQSNKKNSHVSNFAEAKEKTEIIQEKFVDSKGNYYTIVKYKNNLYAVARKELFYQLDPNTGIIKGRAISVTKANLSIIGYDHEPELTKDTKEEETSSTEVRLGRLLPDYFYTAGTQTINIKIPKGLNKYYFTLDYNEDGSIKMNPIPAQQRWFTFVGDKTISSEEFKKKYKLRFVINNGTIDEVFDSEDAPSISTKDIIIDNKVVKGREDEVDIRALLVDKTTNEPIKVDGKLVFTSIHTPGYEGVTDTDLENKKKAITAFRAALIKEFNEKPNVELYSDVLDLSSGSVAREQSIEQQVGDTGNTYRGRQRFPVVGRIIRKGANINTLEWGIVKVTKTDQVIGVEIGGTLLNNNKDENGMVFTAISDRNGNPLKVKLLTRPLNDVEATTAAYMIKEVANGKSEINGNIILPTKSKINNPADRPLISRFIRWGTNSNNKKTQIFFDKNDNLILGDNFAKLTKADLNKKEGIQQLIDWLKAVKIAHVSEKYKGETDFISYRYNTETQKFISEVWSTYNNYLFDNKSKDGSDRTPILTTDVIELKEDSKDNSNQLLQVNIHFNTRGFIVKPNNTTSENTNSSQRPNILNTLGISDEELLGFVSDTMDALELQRKKTNQPAIENTIENKIHYISGIPIMMKNDGLDIEGHEKEITDYIIYLLKKSENSPEIQQVTDAISIVNTIIKNEEGIIAPGITAASFTKDLGSVKGTLGHDDNIEEDESNFRLIDTWEAYTTEDTDKAKQWFTERFPDIPISYEMAKELSRNKAWGVLHTTTGVLISNIAKEGTTYHEAWHVVSKLALTPAQIQLLYNSVRKELNSPNMSDREVEEILADDFMNWKLSGKSPIFTKTKTKQTLFERILSWLNKVWDFFTKNQINALQIYNNIDKGVYSNVKLSKKTNESLYRLKGLSVEESEDLLGGLSYNIVTTLYEKYGAELNEFADYADAIIKQVVLDIDSKSKVPIHIKEYIKNKENKDEIISGIKQYLEYIGVGIKVESSKDKDTDDTNASEIAEEDRSNNASEYLDSVMFSSLKNVSNEIKLLIATLPEVVVQEGKLYNRLNSVGLPKLVNFGKTYMTILDALSGTSEIEGEVGIKAKLQKLSLTHPEITKLINRLNALKGNQAINTWMQFRQAFSINKYGFQIFLIDELVNKFVEANRTKASDKIKEIWNNGYKESKAFSDVKKDDLRVLKNTINSYLEIINNPKKDADTEFKKVHAFQNALRYLGILSDNNINSFSKDLLNDNKLRQEIKLILSDFANSKTPIYDLIGQFQTGRFTKLAEAQAEKTQLFIEPQHLNPEGKSIYEYSLNNFLTGILNEIKQCALLPLESEDGTNPRVERFKKELPHLWGIKQYSSWVNIILNDLEQPIPKLSLNIEYLEGTKKDASGEEGKLTRDLSETSLANLHLHAMFNKRGSEFFPMFVFRRPSDKSLEPALSGLPFIKETDKFKELMLKYLQFELDVAGNDINKLVIFRRRPEDVKEDIILSSRSLKKIEAFKQENTLPATNILDIPEIRASVETDIENFLEKKTVENLDYFNSIGILSKNSTIISSELLDSYNNNLDRLVRDFTMNWTISAFEQSFLFHGNFSQYKEFFKRTSGYVGTGKTLSKDKIVNDKIQGDILTFLRESKSKGIDISNRLDLGYKLTSEQRREFPEFSKIVTDRNSINSTNIAIIKEIKKESDFLSLYKQMLKESIKNISKGKVTSQQISNYMKAYESMEVADGLGHITIDEYRNILLKTGDWNLLGEQERVYQKIIRGDKLTLEEVAYFPPIKPQAFGIKNFLNNIDTEGNISSEEFDKIDYEVAFIKLALFPIIPFEGIENLQLGNLLKSMQKSGVTISIMESAIKVGNKRANDFNGDEITNLNSFNLDNRYWKIQVDMSPEIEEEDTDGTQQRKLLWQDLFEYGKPIDPVFEDLHKEYSDVYQKLIDIEKEKFLKELSVKNIDGKYNISDYKKFTETIKKEIISRRLPSNILQAITVDSEGNMLFPIDALPIASKIENILFARINNNLIKLKRPGAAYVQTSNLFWKSNKNLTAEQEGKVKQFAEDLKFLRNDKGKIVGAEIMLPSSWLEGFVKPGEDLNKLVEEGKLDPRLLKTFGYRIPTQGQNSMLPLIIKGFLPAEFGDTVIVPFEIVAQSGSDFDIDKLHIFRPNFLKTYDGIKYITEELKAELEETKILYNNSPESKLARKMFGITDEEVKEGSSLIFGNKIDKAVLQNRLLEIQLEVLSNPLNTRNLLVPNGADFLKEEADWTVYLKTVMANKDVIPESVQKDDSFNRWRANRIERNKKEGTNPNDLISFKKEIETALSFKGGKKGVGIVANEITAHSLFQQANTTLSGTIRFKEKGKWGEDIPVIFNFNYNKVSGKPSLAGIYDVSGNLISEVNSEHLTGNVDIAKDPFIFTLNTNGLTSNVKYMLLNLGADREWTNRFINQPIIERYIKRRQINESIEIQSTRGEDNSEYESDEAILESLFEEFGGKIGENSIGDVLKDIHNSGVIYNLEQLDKFIIMGAMKSYNDSELRDIYNKAQRQLLADFVAYQVYGRAFNDGIQAVKPDTRRLKNMNAATKVIEDIQKVKQTGFYENIDNLLNEGILKGFNSAHAQFMKDVYKSLFVTELNSIQERIYNKIKDDITFNGFTITEKELNSIQQTILTYLFQVAVHRYIARNQGIDNPNNITTPLPRNFVKNLMVGENSVGRVLQSIIKEGKKTNMIFSDLLYPQLGNTTEDIDYVKTINKKIDAYTADRLSEAMEEFYNEFPDGYNLLLETAAAEFGMGSSFISYMKFFDSNRIASIFSPILKQLTTTEDGFDVLFSNDDKIIDDIYILNRINSKFIPKITLGKTAYYPKSQKVWNKDNHVIVLNENNSLFGRRFIKTGYYVKDTSGEQIWVDNVYKLEAVKEGKIKEAVYVRVPVKGNLNLKEFYDRSIIPNNSRDSNSIKPELRKEIVDHYKSNKDTIEAEAFKETIDKEISKEEKTENLLIQFEEEQSYGYKLRTYKNASADATIAFAEDFTSAGEKLTYGSVYKQSKQYIPINTSNINQTVEHREFNAPKIDVLTDKKGLQVTPDRINKIIDELNKIKPQTDLFNPSPSITLNIAGNGIYTFKGKYTQDEIDSFVYNVLKEVINSPKLKNNISLIRTGGQTGVDEAGAKAGIKLGIPTLILAPKGWTFRDISGRDISNEKAFKDRFNSIDKIDETNEWKEDDNDSEVPFCTK